MLNLLKNGNYNPYLVWFNKIQKIFLCVYISLKGHSARISGSQPVGRDPKRGRDTNAMGSLIDFDPTVNII